MQGPGKIHISYSQTEPKRVREKEGPKHSKKMKKHFKR